MCRFFSHWFASETHETRKARVFFPFSMMFSYVFHDFLLLGGDHPSSYSASQGDLFLTWISERPFVNVYEWIDGGCFTNHNFSIFTYTFTICFRIFGGSKGNCFLHFPCNVQWQYDVCHLKSTAFVGQPLGFCFLLQYMGCWNSKEHETQSMLNIQGFHG